MYGKSIGAIVFDFRELDTISQYTISLQYSLTVPWEMYKTTNAISSEQVHGLVYRTSFEQSIRLSIIRPSSNFQFALSVILV